MLWPSGPGWLGTARGPCTLPHSRPGGCDATCSRGWLSASRVPCRSALQRHFTAGGGTLQHRCGQLVGDVGGGCAWWELLRLDMGGLLVCCSAVSTMHDGLHT